MSQELQTSGQFTTLSLWGSPICYDKKVVQLKEFSTFLEQRAKKSAEDFLLIGQQQKMGWLIAGTDFLEKEMRQVCSEVGDYITAHNILDNPNWELFLQPKIMFADAAKQLILDLHDTLIKACINNTEEQAQQAYRNSLANSEGLGFGIISSSLTAHFVYAMQAAQKERENEQAAQDAANRVRRNSSSVEKAGELTAKAYHETHEPYVIDSLAQFYGEVESFIYTGADYDKPRLDTLAKEAVETIDTANGTDMQAAIVLALQKDVCCGEAVFAAIRYGLVDDDLIKFCDYAPLKLLKSSFKPITAWLKKEKHTNQLYNRPVFGAKTMQNLGTIQRVFLSSGKPKPALYNKILEDVYSDEISNAFSAFNGIFHFDNSALDRYASNRTHLIVSDPIVSLMILLCNDLHCSKLVSLVSGAGLVLPITRDQLHKCIDAVNNKIDVRHAEIQEERREKAIRDAANKAERYRIEAEDRARKQAEAEKKRQRNTKIIKISAAILIPVIAGTMLWNLWLCPDIIQPSKAYSEAERLLAEGYYSDAATAFEALGDYKDSQERLEEVVTCMMDDIYEYGIQLMQDGMYESAIEQFEALGNYRDAFLKIDEAKTLLSDQKYNTAVSLFNEESFENAKAIFEELGTYKDSVQYYNQCIDLINLEANYNKAISLYNKGYYSTAYEIFANMDDYKDCEDYTQLCVNKFAEIDMHNVLMLFPMIDYEISLKSLCGIIGNTEYTSGLSSYTNGIMYRTYSFDDNYMLDDISSEITFRFKWENEESRTNEDAGILIAMTWHCPEEISNYDKYLELKQYIIDILGAPTKESTAENSNGDTYAYYTYWNDMQLSYSTAIGNNIYLGRNIVWGDE